jgi:hypothetical protein
VNWLALLLVASVLTPPGPHNAYAPDTGAFSVVVSAGGVSPSGQVVVSNTSGGTLTDVSVEFTLNTATLISGGAMAADCGIQVNNPDIGVVPYWLEGGCNTTTTTYWFKAASLPTGDTTYTLYFAGVGPVYSTSYQKASVFVFFDDFDGGSIDAKWTDTTGAPTVSGGSLTLTNAQGVFAGGSAAPFDHIFETSVAITGAPLGSVCRLSTNTTTGWVGDGGSGIVGILLYVGQIYLETSTGEYSGVFVDQTGLTKEYRIEYRPDSTGNVTSKYDGGNAVTASDASSTSSLYPVLYNASASSTMVIHWARLYKDTTGVVSAAASVY